MAALEPLHVPSSPTLLSPNSTSCGRYIVEAADSLLPDLDAGDLSRLRDFVDALNTLRLAVTIEEWQRLTAEIIRPHPVTTRLLEEPFTHRSFAKPRQYAGDAPMLDLVYGEGPYPNALSPLGERLHLWATHQPACVSVRMRRDFLTSVLNDSAAELRRPRILSLACGHLREARRAIAVRAGLIEELVAIDQDRESLAEVARDFAGTKVNPVCRTIQSLIAGRTSIGSFDLAYSAGLYDYLSTRVAALLTTVLFRCLRPGGRLLVANFVPDMGDIGYMEAIMDWQLIYRSEDDMLALLAAVPPSEIASATVFRDEPGNIVYLDVRRA